MVSELSVTIKDEEKRLNKKFLIYETYQVNEEDPLINGCIKETLENFDGEPSHVTVSIKMDMK